MRAICLSGNKYHLEDIIVPSPKDDELLINVAFAGINRADLFQKEGRYPLPEHKVPGLEVSGVVEACGRDVTGFKPGDHFCALVSEGAFAEYIAVPAAQALPVPPEISLDEAAALPEAAFTAWVSLVWQAHIQPGETVLIHGGAGGIGSLAIQIARELGAQVFTTAGTPEKCAACTKLGAHAINYQSEDFVEVIARETSGKGVDVILDVVGGDYVARNLKALALDGRLCIIAFLKGSKIETNLSPILLKHLSVMGSTLRARPAEEKAKIAAELKERIWPALARKNGIKPLISRIFPLEEAEKALESMHQGLNCGKILLKI